MGVKAMGLGAPHVAWALELWASIARSDGARPLTIRELQVCTYAALGRSNKFIACKLGISRPRVTCLLNSARQKLRARTQVHLVRKIHELGGFDLLRKAREEDEAARADPRC